MGMRRRGFLGRVLAAACAAPAAVLCRSSLAAGKVSQRRGVVRGVVMYRSYPAVLLEDGTTRKAQTVAHFWTQDSLRTDEEYSRIMDLAECVVGYCYPQPTTQVYLTSIDMDLHAMVEGYRRRNPKMQVRSWTYFPDSDTMTISSEWVQKRRQMVFTKEAIERFRELFCRARKENRESRKT